MELYTSIISRTAKKHRKVYERIEYVKRKWSKTPVEEQETVIQISRDSKFANIWTNDSTMVTKLEKKYKHSRETHNFNQEITSYSYDVPKKDIQFRPTKPMSEETKKKLSERMKAYQFKKKV